MGACWDQIWFRSSVIKCDPIKYTKGTKNQFATCVTGTTSVDDTEWICSTCHSNLSDGKLQFVRRLAKWNFLRNQNA